MIRIAVLGDIGSGKSYVAKQFGGPVFNADVEVSKLYRKSRKCYNKLKKTLPGYIVSFPVKKIEISKAIIADQHNLKKVIKIVHPEVRFNMNNFIKKNKNSVIFESVDLPAPFGPMMACTFPASSCRFKPLSISLSPIFA